MAAKRCPKCSLVNPATATTCDCGWSFQHGEMTDARRYRPGDTPADRKRGWVQTAVLVVGGLVIKAVGGAVTVEQPDLAMVLISVGWFMTLIGAISGVVRVVRLMSR